MALRTSFFQRLGDELLFSHHEKLKYEAFRLKTFANWAAFDKASPVMLAKAGFHYLGADDIVKCHVCLKEEGNWNRNMNPMLVHQEHSPTCAFCQSPDNENVPIFVPEEPSYQQIIETLHHRYCLSDTPEIPSVRAPLANTTRNDSTPRQTQMPRVSQTQYPVVALDAGLADTSLLAIVTSSQISETPAPVREEFAPMKHEANRFASFDANWPGDGTPDPRDLARAGFYFTGSVDRVQCVFCRGILRNWDEDDVPMEEHRRHFPMCPFVLGLEVGNVPDPAAVVSANRTSEFINVFQPVVNDATLGIVTERPKHSQYAVEAARMSSFRNWPRGKEQTPEALAKAGFFFAGFGDSVKCFYCDGGLKTWERGDDPWTEHARWFPRCPFVRQVKGDEFVKAAQGNNQMPASSSNIATAGSDVGFESGTVQSRDVSARMDTPLVRTVLDMGLPRERVRRAIELRLQLTGDDFLRANALAEAVLELPDDPTPTAGAASHPQDPPQLQSQQSGRDTEEGDEDAELLEENRQLKEQRQCKICMDEEVSVVFLPCGHLVCCSSCAPALRKCPVCRANIKGTVRTFMS